MNVENQQSKIDNFTYGVLSGGKIIYFSIKQRMLESLDLATGNTSAILIPQENSYYEWITQWKGNYLALDGVGRYLYILYPNEKKVERVYLPCEDNRTGLFMGLETFENDILIIPRYQAALWVYDSKKMTVKRHSYPVDKDYGKLHDQFKGVRYQEEYWLFPYKASSILKFSFKSHSFLEYSAPKDFEKCIHAVVYKNHIYILTKEGHIWIWNPDEQRPQFILGMSGRNDYYRLIVTDMRYYVLPYDLKNGIFTITRDGKCEELENYPRNYLYDESIKPHYAECVEDNERVYYLPNATSHILVISKKTGDICWTMLSQKRVINRFVKEKENLTSENRMGDFSWWLSTVVGKSTTVDLTERVQYYF